MRILISYDTGKPHGLGSGAFIVDEATSRLIEQLHNARANTPDEILSIPNARVHVSAGTPGTASLRAGHITNIREF